MVTPEGYRAARWGAGTTWHWDWGVHFGSIDDVLAYGPLEHMDQRDTDVVAEHDYRPTVEELAAELRASLDAARAATGSAALVTGGILQHAVHVAAAHLRLEAVPGIGSSFRL